MVKTVCIEFLTFENCVGSAYYRVQTKSNAQAIIDALNKFTEQCSQNGKEFEIVSVLIEND